MIGNYQTFKNVNFVTVDAYGNILTKTKQTHPYNYDAITTYIEPTGIETTNCVYTDRLAQWDYKKLRLLSKKHFGNEGDYWGDRTVENIQNFLRDWAEDENLILTKVMEYCNQATGYPVWRLDYSSLKGDSI